MPSVSLLLCRDYCKAGEPVFLAYDIGLGEGRVLLDMRRIAIAKTIANALKRHIEGEEILDVDADLKRKGAGYGENKA